MKHQFSNDHYERVLSSILEELGLKRPTLTKIGDYQNIIFAGAIDGVEQIIRITDETRRSKQTLIGELEWITFLKENGVSVASPLPAFNDEYIFDVEIDGVTFFASLFEKAAGDHIGSADWSDELIRKFGSLIGEMHHMSSRFEPSDSVIKRPSWNDNLPSASDCDSHRNLQIAYQKLRHVVAQIEELESRPLAKQGYGLIHSDLNFGNVIYDQDKITCIDFDDCCYSWFVQDIAVLFVDSVNLFCSPQDKVEFSRNFFDNFFTGYHQFRTLEPFEKPLLQLFAKLRELELYIELSGLSEEEYFDHERQFMINRLTSIEEDIPFIEFQ